jgi:hypothetical protein
VPGRRRNKQVHLHLDRPARVILIARLLPTPALIPPAPGATLNVTPLEEPSSVRDLPWLHIVHRLLLCPAFGTGCHPVFHFYSGNVAADTNWPRCHRLDVLFVDLQIQPSALASSYAPSTHLYTTFLCLLIPLVLRTASGYPSRRTDSLLVGYHCSHSRFPTLCVP